MVILSLKMAIFTLNCCFWAYLAWFRVFRAVKSTKTVQRWLKLAISHSFPAKNRFKLAVGPPRPAAGGGFSQKIEPGGYPPPVTPMQ